MSINFEPTSRSIEMELPQQRVTNAEVINRIFAEIEKSSEDLSQTALLTLRHLREDSYVTLGIKTLAGAAGIGLLAVGAITLIASGVIFAKSPFSNSIEYDNLVTNTGAVNAFITDIPAIMLMLYILVLREVHRKAKIDLLGKSYRSYIASSDLSPEIRDGLYQLYLAKGGSYLNSVKTAVSVSEITRRSLKEFAEQSATKKLSKLSLAIPLIGVQALSIFLIYLNSALLFGTPVNTLFSNNATVALNEASELTQMGGLFSSITAWGASVLVLHKLFVSQPK